MKASLIFTVGIAAVANAHAIAQRVKVAGVDKGQMVGVRAPSDNNPILNVQDANMACNQNRQNTPVDATVIAVAAGQEISVWWQHVFGGPQYSGDADNPIAKSHKGPLIYYLAKVDNAAYASPTGLQWFKVAQDGLDTNDGTWGVDRMIQNNGWHSFTLPSCVAPGQYLLRTELIALHSAGTSGQAQFYLSCVQINVTGSGSKTGSTMSFPGAYQASDPGILISIYDAQGNPTNGKKPYAVPGGNVMTC
ncbi:glycoside hydrolase [Pseudovirgaria hyperparasitica]|uniref:AA9 family lytic polysaccharide monooxygenase n=1 Tax=Pseudovirgaria hyperparasitica TaxID=470096 RepID=A0A6A6W8E9_9PEZI|nr:glycoside hydrolase [Pseudovirgaria hyperparasitica]KAF2758166.1 glycoside hydrolase [Pseudovirgaria hyperparasitica]